MWERVSELAPTLIAGQEWARALFLWAKIHKSAKRPILLVYSLIAAAGYAYPGLVAHPNGALVPAEPADVVAARAEHLAHF